MRCCFAGEGAWDDHAILVQHRQEVVDNLGDAEGVLAPGGRDLPKHRLQLGNAEPEWRGRVGKSANRQVSVPQAYVSLGTHVVMDLVPGGPQDAAVLYFSWADVQDARESASYRMSGGLASLPWVL